jgi:hypothetical protein
MLISISKGHIELNRPQLRLKTKLHKPVESGGLS